MSSQSTHEKREASIDFRLSLRNVCWDLPLTAAASTETEWSFKVTKEATFTFSPMDTHWGNYCGGFIYEIIYVAGSFENDSHPSGDTTLIGPDLNAFFTIEYTADPTTGDHQVTSLPADPSWFGMHTFLIRGTNGEENVQEYNSIDSDTFTITWTDLCSDNELTLNAGIDSNTYHVDRQSLVNLVISSSELG